MSAPLACFKAYDIRGRVPDELDDAIAYRIGRAYAELLRPRSVVLGRDVRLSGPVLSAALSRSLTDSGVEVIDIGLCGTEQVYFATPHFGADGGIMVTASHNPADYNGMKLVREGSRPISGDTGLLDIRRRAEEMSGTETLAPKRGLVRSVDGLTGYVAHLLETQSAKDRRQRGQWLCRCGDRCARAASSASLRQDSARA
jgi:phosphomannomutase